MSLAPLSLQKRHPDLDTVETIRDLLAKAERGEILGFAYVTLRSGGDFSGNVTGIAKTHPIYALGLVKALERKLAALLD